MPELDTELRQLFKWAVTKYSEQARSRPVLITPEVLVRLLSVEGMRNELKVDEIKGDVPRKLSPTLRLFRHLSQSGRLSRTSRLLAGP